jgi:hypothetical protein
LAGEDCSGASSCCGEGDDDFAELHFYYFFSILRFDFLGNDIFVRVFLCFFFSKEEVWGAGQV